MKKLALMLGMGLLFSAQAWADNHLRAACDEGHDNLLSRLAEDYAKQGGPRIERQAAGNPMAVLGLLDSGQADVVLITSATAGMPFAGLTKKYSTATLGTDAMAFIVHPANPVSNLDAAKLNAILRGEYRDWKPTGMGDGPILRYGLGSGNAAFHVIRAASGGTIPANTQRLRSAAHVTSAVSESFNAFGWAPVSLLRTGEINTSGVKVLMIQSGKAPVSPSDSAAVSSGSYPHTWSIIAVGSKQPSPAVLGFLQFVAGKGGSMAAAREKLAPPPPAARAENQRTLSLKSAARK